MKKFNSKKLICFILCALLVAATALCTAGCGQKNLDPVDISTEEVTIVGKGQTAFNFVVIDQKGETKAFEVHTDEKTVGKALLNVELIAGEDSEYGLYVKTVNGITLDYNTDGKYWAFYVNGEYATAGVESIDIDSDTTYTFKAE